MRVARLIRYPEKKEPGISADELSLIEGLGIEGNLRKSGDKQVSLLSVSARGWIDGQGGSGLCHKRFKENILIDGLPDKLPAGAGLAIGGAVLTVSCGKECFSECPLHAGSLPCMLSQSAAFASVKRGGVIKTGDCVEII